jgi:hypothetical protein
VTAEAQQRWQAESSKIEQGLSSDRQKLAVRQRSAMRWQSLSGALDTHAMAESDKYATDTYESGLANRVNAAASDPATADHAAEEAQAIVTDFASGRGWSPEVLQERRDGAVSQIHAAAIHGLLARGDDLAASRYYDAHRDAIVGTDRTSLDRALEEGSVLGEGQREADRIIGATGTLHAAFDDAREIKDPRVRKEVEGRITEEYQRRAAADRADREHAYQSASATLEATGSYHAIPLGVRQKLSASENSALQSRATQMQEGPKRRTDEVLYYTLANLASLNDATKGDFRRADLTEWRDRLDEADFNRLISIQRELRDDAARPLTGQQVLGEELAKAERAKHPEPTTKITVPQDWIDRAMQGNEEYTRYLRDLGVSLPGATRHPAFTGNIDLRTPSTRAP